MGKSRGFIMVVILTLSFLLPGLAVAGIALWSFAALMLVMAGIGAVLDVRGLWARASQLR